MTSDVEYRIHQVVEVRGILKGTFERAAHAHQEAARFMRHARRTTMTTSDIDQALRVLNIEPLYGHYPHNPPTFRRVGPYPPSQASGSVYFVEDEEIDFTIAEQEEGTDRPPMTAAELRAHKRKMKRFRLVGSTAVKIGILLIRAFIDLRTTKRDS